METSPTEELETVDASSSAKQEIYKKLGELARDRSNGSKMVLGKDLYDMAMIETIKEVIKNGAIRLNRGLGSIHDHEYKAGTRKTPRGDMVDFPARNKMRYHEGKGVDRMRMDMKASS